MKEIEIYKVVRPYNRQLHSAYSGRLGIPYTHLRYRVGRWIRPKVGSGPLAAFQTIEQARVFRDKDLFCELVIYRARAVRSRSRSLWYIKTVALYGRFLAHQEYPGTVYCDKIKLLGRVV